MISSLVWWLVASHCELEKRIIILCFCCLFARLDSTRLDKHTDNCKQATHTAKHNNRIESLLLLSLPLSFARVFACARSSAAPSQPRPHLDIARRPAHINELPACACARACVCVCAVQVTVNEHTLSSLLAQSFSSRSLSSARILAL